MNPKCPTNVVFRFASRLSQQTERSSPDQRNTTRRAPRRQKRAGPEKIISSLKRRLRRKRRRILEQITHAFILPMHPRQVPIETSGVWQIETGSKNICNVAFDVKGINNIINFVRGPSTLNPPGVPHNTCRFPGSLQKIPFAQALNRERYPEQTKKEEKKNQKMHAGTVRSTLG